MHLIIPFAASKSEAGLVQQRQLELPNLSQLLRRLQPAPAVGGDALSFSTPHEWALAESLGLPLGDGQIAWAAYQARQKPTLAQLGGAWAFITLCHWQMNTHHVAMSPPPLPALSQQESTDLLVAMRPYFQEDGISLYDDQPGRWLAHSPTFQDVRSASLDRVFGRDLEPWMPLSAMSAGLRRLQNEMQMLLYTHPVNDARLQRGAVPINSFWLSGTGALPVEYTPALPQDLPQLVDNLRMSALTEDWTGWSQAWQTLDAQQVHTVLQAARAGHPVQLTLCGEQRSQSWRSGSNSIWQPILRLFRHDGIPDVLSSL